MRKRTLGQHEVHGEDFNIPRLKPMITFQKEIAEEAERLLKECAADGRLALASSDHDVYGRDGIGYESRARYLDGHGINWPFDYAPTDTVQKLVERCQTLSTIKERPDVVLALQYAREERLYELGSYLGEYFRDLRDNYPEDKLAVAALDVNQARTFLSALRPHWTVPELLRVRPM